jgi:hypothetical protein
LKIHIEVENNGMTIAQKNLFKNRAWTLYLHKIGQAEQKLQVEARAWTPVCW